MRRGETVDAAYMEDLYDSVISLYRLNLEGGDSGSAEAPQKSLGPLPKTSVALLTVLAGTWVLMGVYVLCGLLKKKKEQK